LAHVNLVKRIAFMFFILTLLSSLSSAIFVNININLASAKKSSHSSGGDSNDTGTGDIINSNGGNGDGGSGSPTTTPSTDQGNIASSTTSINEGLTPQQQYQQCLSGIGGGIPGNCKPPSSTTTSEQNFAPQTLTPPKCELLPTDANGNCQRINMQDGGVGLPPQLGSQEKQQAHYNLPFEATHIKQLPDGSCPADYHYSTNSSSGRYCVINVYQKNPDGSCPAGIIMTTNNECVKMPVLPGTSTGSTGGGFIQMFPTLPPSSPPATSPNNTTPYLPPPSTK
jgi:hypothetical protein